MGLMHSSSCHEVRLRRKLRANTSRPVEVTGSALVVDHGVYTIVTKEASGLVVVNGLAPIGVFLLL